MTYKYQSQVQGGKGYKTSMLTSRTGHFSVHTGHFVPFSLQNGTNSQFVRCSLLASTTGFFSRGSPLRDDFGRC